MSNEATHQAVAIWTHTFHVPSNAFHRLFQYRSADLWLCDLLDFGDFGYDDVDVEERTDGSMYVTVRAEARTLQFVCVLFNQHANQSPSDMTPEEEGERLELTLLGTPEVRCPNCKVLIELPPILQQRLNGR